MPIPTTTRGAANVELPAKIRRASSVVGFAFKVFPPTTGKNASRYSLVAAFMTG